MIYAVIDTNVIVSALITKNPRAATVKVLEAVLRGEVVPVHNSAILEEYDHVLRRRKFNLDNVVVDSILNYFRAFGSEEVQKHTDIDMPDEDDRVFYEVSLSVEESFLVTGNLRHYPHSPKVVSPSEFIKLLKP
jgi:putative PIN family toxin of toxin-antitoxin system